MSTPAPGGDPYDLSWLRNVDRDAFELLTHAYDTPLPDRPATLPPLVERKEHVAVPRDFPYDPGAEIIPAITCIPRKAWKVLRQHGWLGPDVAQISEHYRHSYDWMRWRMAEKIPTYGGRYPIWFWAMDSNIGIAYHQDGTRYTVMLQLAIPREFALLSDFDGWHAVLNTAPTYHILCPGCGERGCRNCETRGIETMMDAEFRFFLPNCTRGDDVDESWQRISPTALRRITSGSNGWDTIFDQHHWIDWTGTDVPRVQGVTEIIRAEWVTRASLVRTVPRHRRWYNERRNRRGPR